MLTQEWKKSTKSTATGGCVEVRKFIKNGLTKVQVRDSKLGANSPVQEYTEHEWDSFLDGARKGEFDLA